MYTDRRKPIKSVTNIFYKGLGSSTKRERETKQKFILIKIKIFFVRT